MQIPERLETNRLILRPYAEEDTIDFLDSYKIADPGFSLIISNKENETNLGTCGLISIRDCRNVACVYALLPEFRGNGFAIEAMLKLIGYAFIKLEIPKIIAYIHPDNTQGWKVAERIGMKYIGHIQNEDFESKVMHFSIDKREYKAQRD